MRFTKMQGVGNDFVVIDADQLSPDTNLSDVAIETCHRNFGIGADGLLVVSQTPGAETAFRMRMFNPDGTEDMCGNGLRCVGLWAHHAGWLGSKTVFQVATKEGTRDLRLIEVAQNNQSGLLGVDMGVPRFEPDFIPFCDHTKVKIVGYPLVVDDRTFTITAINTGSTHTVIFGDALSEHDFQKYSPLIEHHRLFPERTSIMWATPKSNNIIDIRIWERGAGETLGCGTGASAVGVAAILHNFIAPNAAAHIVSKGGTLQIQWAGPGHSIDMVGPAVIVFDGEITLQGEKVLSRVR